MPQEPEVQSFMTGENTTRSPVSRDSRDNVAGEHVVVACADAPRLDRYLDIPVNPLRARCPIGTIGSTPYISVHR